MLQRTLQIAAAIALAGTCQSAWADHQGYWVNSSDFYVRVTGMTDFDQVRESQSSPFRWGLPGDGSMYCVPTAAANLMAYIEQHGYGPDDPLGFLATGPADDWFENVNSWSQPTNFGLYNTAGRYIQQMGTSMQTHPEDGTNNGNNRVRNAVRSRLLWPFFNVSYFGRTSTWAPKAVNIGDVLREGGIAMFCYGRWNVGTLVNDPILVERTGGHCVTITKVDKRSFMGYASNEYVINYADPGSGGGDSFSQSSFVYRAEEVRDVNYGSEIVPFVFPIRRMSRIMFNISDPEDQRHRIIDSMLAVWPIAGFTTSNTGFTIHRLVFGAPGFAPTVQADPIQWNGVGNVEWAELSPDRSFISVISKVPGGPAQLSAVMVGDKRVVPIRTVDPNNVGAMITSNFDVLVAEAEGMRLVEADDDLPRDERRIEGFIPWPTGFTPLAFGPGETDNVAIAANRVNVFICPTDADPDTPLQQQTLSVPLPADPVAVSSAFGNSGINFLMADGSVHLYELASSAPRLVPSASWTPPAGTSCTDMSVGEDGRLFLVCDGSVQELMPTPEGYEPVAPEDASPFLGMAAQGALQITRSRTNFVPELHSGPAWNNVLPADLAVEQVGGTTTDCPPDIAQPFEELDRVDFNTFLEWFNGEAKGADFATPLGDIDIFDALEYLNAYEAGCFDDIR